MRERDEPAGRSPRPRVSAPVTVGLAGVAIGAGFLVHLREWSFLCDDAFISFRYARNLARHGQLAYNLAPHEPVEGYTNLLWVLLLGLLDLFGWSPERAAPVLTAVCSLAGLLLAALICAQLRRRFGPGAGRDPEGGGPAFELVDLLGPALLATVPEFVVWGSGGLEGSFALALGLLAVWAWLGGRIEGAAAASAAAYLARPDALVWIGAFGIGWLAVVGLERRGLAGGQRPAIPWRRVAIASALFVAPILVALVFRRIYYGAWLPNTWAVKQHGAALREFYGVGYLRFWAAGLGLVWLAPLCLLLRPRHLLVGLPVAATLWWAWSIGGDFMAYGRFVLPATTLGAIWIGLSLAELRDELRVRGWLSPGRATLVWAGLALALVLASGRRIPTRLAADRAHAHLHVEGPPRDQTPGFEGVDAMHRFAAVRYAAGLELARAVPADTTITVGAAGALPYASMLPTFDSYGLVDPGVIAVAEPKLEGARPGHQLRAPLRYMKSHDPDLMCHIGYAGERPPPPGLDRRVGAGPGWTGWACVETGPIADPRAEHGLPSQFYCCMRPRDRFEQLDESALRRSR